MKRTLMSLGNSDLGSRISIPAAHLEGTLNGVRFEALNVGGTRVTVTIGRREHTLPPDLEFETIEPGPFEVSY